MLFPIGDDDSGFKGRIAPVTKVLLLANLLLFGYQFLVPSFTYGFSVIPREIVTGVDLVGTAEVDFDGQRVDIPQEPGPGDGAGAPWIYLTILSAMFMHGGFMHLFGNMLYLWIFGDNVEIRFGALPFLGFYLASGLVATLAQIFLDPTSVIPNLGASGAISGILGAYLVLFPRNRVYALFMWIPVPVPALLVIGLWFAAQLFGGFNQVAGMSDGVAYAAHLGGFVAGVGLGLAHRALIGEPRPNPYDRLYARDPRAHALLRRGR